MRDAVRPLAALVWKDVLLELRTRDIVVSVSVFALLVVVVFSFALDATQTGMALVAPGILWVSFTFGGVLGFTRSFAVEREGGNLRGLLLTPAGRDVIFFGKMVGSFLFMTVMEAVVFPVFVVLYDVSIHLPSLALVTVLATLGVSAVGTLFSAIAANTRSREVMLPILFFPAVLPVIVAASEATGLILSGEGLDLRRWVPLLVVFDAIFLVVCPAAFTLVVEE